MPTPFRGSPVSPSLRPATPPWPFSSWYPSSQLHSLLSPPPLSSPLPSLALPSPSLPSSLLSHGWGGCSTAPATTATPPLVQREATVITVVAAWNPCASVDPVLCSLARCSHRDHPVTLLPAETRLAESFEPSGRWGHATPWLCSALGAAAGSGQ